MTLPKNSEAPPSGIPNWALRGQSVICINAAWSSDPPAKPLRAGATYTIVGAYWRVSAYLPDECFLHLAEVTNPIAPDWGFQASRFHPVYSVKSDIEAHFKALLNVPNQVDA